MAGSAASSNGQYEQRRPLDAPSGTLGRALLSVGFGSLEVRVIDVLPERRLRHPSGRRRSRACFNPDPSCAPLKSPVAGGGGTAPHCGAVSRAAPPQEGVPPLTKGKHDVCPATVWAIVPFVLVDGVPMSPSDVSHLARRLQEDGHTDLAMRVGLAVDTNRRILQLNLEDRELLLRILDGCPHALAPLRAKLRTDKRFARRQATGGCAQSGEDAPRPPAERTLL